LRRWKIGEVSEATLSEAAQEDGFIEMQRGKILWKIYTSHYQGFGTFRKVVLYKELSTQCAAKILLPISSTSLINELTFECIEFAN